MTLCQFKFLETSQQIDLISKHATPIVERTDSNYRYRLLFMDAFYIEEKWDLRLNKFLLYSYFNSEEKLLPYVHTTDLWQLQYRIYSSDTMRPKGLAG